MEQKQEQEKVRPFFVAPVLTSRHYGGPYEGGVWFDAAHVPEARRCWTWRQGTAALRELRDLYPRPRFGRFSCANTGQADVYFVAVRDVEDLEALEYDGFVGYE